jgi:hypothetical protein
MEKDSQVHPLLHETEPEQSKENTRIPIVIYVVVIFFGLELIFCGGYAIISNHKIIEHEKQVVELKARSRGHSFDGVPRCIVYYSCLFMAINANRVLG